MIGRGTRLCPDLFGPGQDKSEFFIFDFCANFEYFDENPAGAVGGLAEPLQKRLFKRRLELMSVLPAVAAAGSAGATAYNLGEGRGGYDALVALRGEIAAEIVRAACRASVGEDVDISVAAGTLKNKNKREKH